MKLKDQTLISIFPVFRVKICRVLKSRATVVEFVKISDFRVRDGVPMSF
jgi:hypothetical protein